MKKIRFICHHIIVIYLGKFCAIYPITNYTFGEHKLLEMLSIKVILTSN